MKPPTLRALACALLAAAALSPRAAQALVRPAATQPPALVGGPAPASPAVAQAPRVTAALERLAATSGGTLAVHVDAVTGLPRAVYAVEGALAPALEGTHGAR